MRPLTKKIIKNMCDTFDSFEELSDEKNDLAGKARYDLGLFMMHLSGADKKILIEESVEISELCQMRVSPKDIMALYQSNNLGTKEFSEKVPESLKLAVTIDKALETDFAKKIVEAYRNAGIDLIRSDNDYSEKEMALLKEYIEMLQKYLEEAKED